MHYKKHIYTSLIFIFAFCSSVFAQEKADFQLLQSQSNDTLYLKFELKRTSGAPFLMGGYNLVFKVDPAVVDTANFGVVDQGIFGVSNSYSPVQILKVSPGVFQLALIKKFPSTGSGITLQNASFQNAGIAAFKIKKCGSSGLSFPNKPNSAIVDWVFNDVDVNTIPVIPLNVAAKVSPKPNLNLSKSIVCPNTSIDITADSNLLFSNYTLFSKSKTGLITPIGPSQNKSVFKNIVVTDTTSYFVTFNVGTCLDTTTFSTANTAPSPAPITISASNNSPCLGDFVSYTASPKESANKYVWNLSPIGTQAVFVGSSNGVGLNSVVVDFKGGAPYSVTISVQDTSANGCASIVSTKIANPIVCSFNADFQVNGSNFAVSTCQGTQVTFKDASTVSGGLSIQKWEWDFGPGAVPDTFTTTLSSTNPPPVKYTTAGVVGVRLIITNNLGFRDTIVKSPTISVLAGLTETPSPTCGSSSCNEVNFNWQTVQGATDYQVRYKKGRKGIYQPYTSIGIANTYKVDASSVGMGGSLDFNDLKNDTVFFQVRALASSCDTTTSDSVFCRPSYCTTTDPSCKLPPFSLSIPSASCKGSIVPIKVTTTPNNYTASYPNVVFSWDNGKFDTSHVYNAFVTNDVSQSVKFLVIDTTKASCYSLNTISIPVSQILTTKPDLGIQSLECDKVTFVWKHVPGAAKYQIKYSGSCIPTQDTIDAPLGGLAEFYELTGLTDNCKINFNVWAVGGCNITRSDTLISPPTCSCYIGHIPSSNTKSCAFDTARFNISDIQTPNWLISWRNPVTKAYSAFSKDSTFFYVPTKTNTIDTIEYILRDANNLNCDTKGSILDTLGAPGDPSWSPFKDVFCIADAIYLFDDRQVAFPGYTFLGDGIRKIDDDYYFDAALAGVGTHQISYNACGAVETKAFTVVNTPCVSTVVDAGRLNQPEGIYTACDGTIYLSDNADQSLYRFVPGSPLGIPELLARSNSTSNLHEGNVNVANLGEPAGIAFDESNMNDVYFVDNRYSVIKRLQIDKQKIDLISGKVGVTGNVPSRTTPTSQLLLDARYRAPWGLAIHPNADTLYVADELNKVVKSVGIKGATKLVVWKVGYGQIAGSTALPTLGRNADIRGVRNISSDTLNQFFTDRDNNITLLDYSNVTDVVKEEIKKNQFGYNDGDFSTAKVRRPDGVSNRIGDWVYFTDKDNFSLRRVNVISGYIETVAGSLPPNNIDGGASGIPFDARFFDPGPIMFNIRGYMDILDRGTGSAGTATVRRYYIPRWGVGTWDGFDTTYVANCDKDTITPLFGGGKLRVISGKDLTAVTNDAIFAPKDTGQYLLGYYLKIGRCDTTFLKNVYVKEPPKVQLDGDTVCADSFLLKAKTLRDTTVKYKWFGPTKSTSITTSDTSRSIVIKQTGDYYIGVYYGKNKQCSIVDSAHVIVTPGDSGQVQPTVLPVTNGINFPPDSVQICYGTSIDLSMLENKSTQPKFKKFIWNTGDTTRNITAYASADYTVTAIDSIGCEVKGKYRVVQDPLPNICIKATDALGQNLGWGKYVVSTFAGKAGTIGSANGIGGNARFFAPWGLAIYKDTLYVSDKNNLVRSISLKDAKVANFIGKLGVNSFVDSVSNAKANAVLSTPQGIRFDKKGNLYVANTGANNIAKYDRSKNFYYAYAGSGTAFYKDSVGKFAYLNQPYDLEIDAVGNVIFTDNQNHAIRSIDYARNVTTLAGSPPNTGQQDGKGLSSSFNWPWGITIDPAGSIYVAEDANQTIRKIDLDSNVSLVAGAFLVKGSNNSTNWIPTPGLTARFARPWNTASDKSGNIFITDAENNLIRMFDKQGDVITIAGVKGAGGAKDGVADTAKFSAPMALAVDPKTQDIYVADQNNHTIRKLTRNKVVYVCKGSAYQIADTCPKSTANFDIVWQKRTSTGLSTVGNIAQPFTDTATYILTITPKLNGITCANPIIDSVVVKWNLKNKANLSVLSPTSTFVPCKPDTFKVTGTSGFGKYIWYTRSNATYTPIDTTTTNVTTLKVNLNVTAIDSAYYGFIVQDPLTGCFDTTTIAKELKVKLYPRITPDFTDSSTCVGNTTRFFPVAVDSNQFVYNWDFGVTPTVTSSKSYTSFSYATYGTYQVQMIGWNKDVPSCKDTVTKSVKITAKPRVDLTINGLTDTAKYCGAGAVLANLLAKPVNDVNAAGGPYTYTWQETFPKGGKLDSSQTLDNTVANPLVRVGESSSLFGYKVIAKDVNNCISKPDSVYARVSLPPAFTVDVLPLSPICKGQSVTLTPNETVPSTFPYSYKWDTSGVRLNFNADTLIAPLSSIPQSNVNYNVLIKNLTTLCTTIVSVPVQIKDIQIAFSPIAAQAPCSPADTVQIVANVSNAVSLYQSVKWTDIKTGKVPSTIFNYSLDSLTVDARRDSSRTYQVVIKDKDGCVDSATVNVPATNVQPPSFSITKGKDTSVCKGNSVKVSLAISNGTAPFTFSWDKPAEVNTTDNFNPVITPLDSGKYVVSLIDANNCKPVTDTVTISLYDMKIAATNDAGTGLCRSSTNPNPTANLQVTVTDTPSVTGATYIYSWKNIATGLSVGTNSPTVSNIGVAGSYEIDVLNSLTGCLRKDTTSFSILNKPANFTLTAGVPTISCSARNIQLSTNFALPNSSKGDSIVYSWRIGSKPVFQTSNIRDSVITVNLAVEDSGNVTFTVYVQNKCDIDSGKTTVNISGTPKPNSDLKGDTLCVPNVPLVASIVKDTTLNYAWSGPDNINTSISNDSTRSIKATSTGKYWVLIYDKLNPGCNRLDSANVLINTPGKGAIQVVNGTPNLDSITICYVTTVDLVMKEATTTQARFKTFLWNTTEKTDTITASGTKTYNVSATDSIGCITLDTFKVIEQPLPVTCINVIDTAGNKLTITNKEVFICANNQYYISDPCNPTTNNSTDSLIVSWQAKDVNGVVTSINPNGVTQTGSFTYIETITPKLNGVACLSSTVDSVVVKERLQPTISIVDTGKTYVCNNQLIGLSALPATFTKYYWFKTPSTTGIEIPYDTTLTNSTSSKIVTLDPNNNFIEYYGVAGVDQFGCLSQTSTTVKAVLPVPTLDFSVESSCFGQITKFIPAVLDTNSKFIYTWDFGDTNSLSDVSSKAIDVYKYPKPGSYNVKMSGDYYLGSGCIDTVEKVITISIPAKIDLSINGIVDTAKICGSTNTVSLNAVVNSTSSPFTYVWSEVKFLGGNLDSSSTKLGNTTAKPVVKIGETSSLYGFSVQATDSGGCTSEIDTAFVRVSTPPDFGLALATNDSVCKGTQIQITATNLAGATTIPARFSYDWDTSSVSLGINQATLLSVLQNSNTYRLTVTDTSTGCSSQYDTLITVINPTINILPITDPLPFAAPDSVSIVAQVTNAVLPLKSIQWLDSTKNTVPTALYNPNFLTVSAYRDTTRSYALLITDGFGCSDTAYVKVKSSSSVKPAFRVARGKDTSVCVGGVVKIGLEVKGALPPYKFTWTSDKQGTPAPEVDTTTDVLNPTIPALSNAVYPKTYYVTYYEPISNTTVLDSVVINQLYNMTVNISSSTTNSLCRTLANPNPSTNYQAIVSDSVQITNPSYNYTWTNKETGQVVSTGSPFLNNVTTSGTYEVEVTNTVTTCVRKNSVDVSILNAPENPVISLLNPNDSCNNHPINLKAIFNSPAKAIEDSIVYQWSVIGGANFITSFDSSVVYIPNPSDTGIISFKVTASNRCDTLVSNPQSIRLIVGATAKLDVDSKEAFVNKDVIFTNNSTNTDSLNILTITDGTKRILALGEKFTQVFPFEGKYLAKLYVFNKNGCDAQDSVYITVIDKINIFLPNVFSPSANDENNRFFRVYGLNISPQGFNLIVYNRWGQLVYSTNDLYNAMNHGWDGKDSSGDSQMGVYTYILTGKFNTGVSINKTGTVSLIR